MAIITSTANSKVKRLVSLCQKSKTRREEGLFIAEGMNMFGEAPAGWIKEVYVSESFLDKNRDIINKTLPENIRYETLSDEVFKKVSDTQTPQGILCVLEMPRYSLDEAVKKWEKSPFLLLLEDLQDPGNLGTMLRAGEGAGVDGVIMTRQTADIFNPKVIRSTAGSIYRVPFFVVDDLACAINLLKENGISVYAAHLDGSVDYDAIDYTAPSAFLIGNEGSGLRRETAACATQCIKIPMAGQVESLNAAAAATVLMYEAARQRRRARTLHDIS